MAVLVDEVRAKQIDWRMPIKLRRFLHVSLAVFAPLSSNALTVTNPAVADAFVRATMPASNFGGAGSLAVSGASATNAAGYANGVFDTLMRFSPSGAIASFDSAFGPGNWVLSGATLWLTEQAAPTNTNFNRGTGSFEIRWMRSDAWLEGTGNPNSPTTDGVTYNDLSSLLNSLNDVSLGAFGNAGVNALQSFTLPLSNPNFANDVLQGNEVSFYLTALSANIGFTFHSRNSSSVSSRPFLALTAVAVPEPAPATLLTLGFAWFAVGRVRWRAYARSKRPNPVKPSTRLDGMRHNDVRGAWERADIRHYAPGGHRHDGARLHRVNAARLRGELEAEHPVRRGQTDECRSTGW